MHKQITAKTKQEIGLMEIVFPVDYGKIYSSIAQQQNVKLSSENIFAREMLNDEIIHHIVSLTEYSEQALDAMLTNNAAKLKAVIEETKKLKHHIDELESLVYEDSLTKSYNRKWFDDNYRLDNDKLLIRGSGTIVLIDLNSFKVINDSYGHIAGDKVLTYIALKLKNSGARVVRYGGDEFLLIFDNQSTIHIKTKIESILSHLDKSSFKIDNYSFKVSFSYGMAPFTEGSNVEEVITTADKAMYLFKKGTK